MTVTQTMMVPVPIVASPSPTSYVASGVNSGSAVINSSGNYVVTAAKKTGSGVSASFFTSITGASVGEAVTLQMTVVNALAPFNLNVTEENPATGLNVILGGIFVPMGGSGLYEVSVVPTQNKMKLNMVSAGSAGGSIEVQPWSWLHTQMLDQNVPVVVCNRGDDKYRFGFNGQQKDKWGGES